MDLFFCLFPCLLYGNPIIAVGGICMQESGVFHVLLNCLKNFKQKQRIYWRMRSDGLMFDEYQSGCAIKLIVQFLIRFQPSKVGGVLFPRTMQRNKGK